MMRYLVFAAALLVAACGGGGNPPIPPSPLTIPDLAPYLAQSLACDGNQATPLRDTDPITCRRHDVGHSNPDLRQMRDSFLIAGGAITAWDYVPHGPFDSANAGGDGGDKYEIRGDAAVVTHTQAGRGLETFAVPWTMATRYTVRCESGWTVYTPWSRGCRATVTFPLIGSVDTVISEHGDDNAVERHFLGYGWGNLAWQSFRRDLVAEPNLGARCQDFGWNHPPRPGQRLAGCRISVQVIPADGGLTGAQLWSPNR